MTVRDPRDPRFVNPSWVAPAEPQPPRHRPPPAAYAIAVIMPIFLLVLLAAPLGIVLAVRSARADQPARSAGKLPARPRPERPGPATRTSPTTAAAATTR